jgi:hypothetical protein
MGMVKEVPAFVDKAFSIFSLEDMERLSTEQPGNLPIVGVGYDGAAPKGNQIDPKGNTVESNGERGAAFVDIQFLVVVAIQYTNMGQSDNKQSAMALLHQVRLKLIGYKKVNTRAWRFMGEKPEPSVSVDGLVFYSQVWQTSVPFLGNYSNS